MSLLSLLDSAAVMPLYPYQEQAVSAVLEGFNEFNRQLMVAPTGSGKTIMFSHLAHRTKGRTLILCHREELIEQAADKIHRATGIYAEIEKAERKADLHSRVVVGSVQSLMRTKRLESWPADHFELVVADEAHHAISDSWQRVLQYFNAKILGVTATPDRADKKNLGRFFENIAYEINLFDLIRQGYLAPIAIQSLPIQVDLSKVRMVAGDYDANGLDEAIGPHFREIARAIKDAASFRKVLVFLPLIATSQAFTEIACQEGIAACHIDGVSEDRAEILKAFAANRFDMLCNAMLLTEGYDCPDVDCVVVLRPTKSRALYAQMVGRGTRKARGKDNLLLLDFLWLHEAHSLIKPAHLIAETPEQAQQIMEFAQGRDEPTDLQLADGEVKRQREEKLRQTLEAQKHRKARSVDAMRFFLDIHRPDLLEYEPCMEWEAREVTEGQAKALINLGFDPGAVTCRGMASKILDLAFSRRKLNLATPKQVKYLRQFQHPQPEAATFEEAKVFLDERFNKK